MFREDLVVMSNSNIDTLGLNISTLKIAPLLQSWLTMCKLHAAHDTRGTFALVGGFVGIGLHFRHLPSMERRGVEISCTSGASGISDSPSGLTECVSRGSTMISCVWLPPRTEPLGRSQLVGTEPAVQ